ncbi:platelet endothelial aggregation receptor 1-like isoform X2 [Mizuhopecten yessoensis]|uniref:platelet endothelial aggregation receptor 1-like isoform X2 n=1 Tax=Mizuhopecten yessoensis TaxID=6573 RepID=UPI000B45D579|nr:platelet endothelial aggregation receptor 1-like isoform X2 [Mizuhopecten yessoensis]
MHRHFYIQGRTWYTHSLSGKHLPQRKPSLWRNQNEMYQEMENCSDSERFFYSTVFPSGVCNDGVKWIYKQRSNTPTVTCIPGYVLRERSCVKECVAVPDVKKKLPRYLIANSSEEEVTDLGNSTMNGTNTTKERGTDLDGTGENGTNTTTGKETDIDQTGVNDTNTTKDEMENDECIDGCLCENNSTCDKLTGQCTCRDGWRGIECKEECSRGTYGTHCNQNCTCDVTSCHPVDGCICRSQEQNCNIVCPSMTFGSGCSGQCLCLSTGTQDCGVLDGSCTCKPGWTGTFCDQLCPFGRYGEGCKKSCECESNEFCNPINGVCLCWGIIPGLNCTKDEEAPTAFPQSLLHISILVGGGLIILIAVACTIVAWRRKGSQSKSEYKFNKDSTLKIVHADLPPREDVSRYREEPDANMRTQSCRNKRKSRQDGATRQSGVLNLPSRVASKPPSTVLGFQQYSPTEAGSVDIDELTRHSYINLKDEDISSHVQGAGNDYERLVEDEIKSPYQDYEVCVKSDAPYENVPAKKRSILGSLRKLVRKESHPESDRVHLAEDTSAGIRKSSFVTFNKRIS